MGTAVNSRSRQKQMLEYLEEHSIANVKHLVNLLGASPATIRRDITELDRLGQLKKIRNGAERILAPSVQESPGLKGFYPNISDYSDFEENERIAQKAVELCQDKDSIFIGEGQTNFLMGKYLLDRNIHIYSNYLPLLIYLISEDFPHLVVLGGQYIKSQNLLVSPEKNPAYQGRYLFCSGDGLTEAGLTKSALLAFMEEKKMATYADKIIALVDSAKIGVIGGISLFSIDELDVVITGRNADPVVVALLESKNVMVHLV
jgi:DeoR family transcriptional regulator, ulaG and ulaABCDEF operon transcriptional repressor